MFVLMLIFAFWCWFRFELVSMLVAFSPIIRLKGNDGRDTVLGVWLSLFGKSSSGFNMFFIELLNVDLGGLLVNVKEESDESDEADDDVDIVIDSGDAGESACVGLVAPEL